MSAYSAESLDAVSLRRIFLLATRELFADPVNYGDLSGKLSNFKYSEDPKESTLLVDLDFEYNPKELQPRHAVYVGLDDVRFTPMVLDHKAEISEDRASITYVQSAETALQVRCVAPNADEPLYLATIATAFYFAMRPVFMEELGLSRMDLIGLSKPTLIDKAPTRMFEVSFAAKLAFNFNIISTLEGHRLKSYKLATTALTP
jgi:hypothetical protein